MPGVLQVADVEDLKLDVPIGWSMEAGLEIIGQVFSGVGLSEERLIALKAARIDSALLPSVWR